MRNKSLDAKNVKALKSKFAGNVAFYHYCYMNRTPLFLQRNLRRVLDHEAARRRQLAFRRAGESLAKRTGSLLLLRSKSPRSSSSARPCSIWRIDDVAERAHCDRISADRHADQLFLQIDDLTLLRSRPSQVRARPLGNNPASSFDGDDTRAVCSLKICEIIGQNETRLVQTIECPCELKARSNDSSIRVELSQHMHIPADYLVQFFRSSGVAGDSRKYKIQMTLSAGPGQIVWPPRPICTCGQSRNARKQATSTDQPTASTLTVNLDNPSRCQGPRFEVEWQCYISVDSEICQCASHWSLKLMTTWHETASIWHTANRSIRQKHEQTARAQTKKTTQQQQQRYDCIQYIMRGLESSMPSLVFSGNVCAFCPERALPHIDHLKLHLLLSHSLFKFDFPPSIDTSHDSSSICTHVVLVDVADAHDTRAEARVFEQLRPHQPFDLSKFMAGDHSSWLGKPGKKAVPEPDPSVQHTSKHKRTHATAFPTANEATPRAPEAVPDLAPRVKRRYRVPPAPAGVTFYRLRTRRALIAGEEISDSEDERDEPWLQQRQKSTIASLEGADAKTKKFLLRWDQHMVHENITSNRLASEALVRFCRQNAAWIQREPGMKLQFLQQLASLHREGWLAWPVVKGCCDLIQGLDRTTSN